jgi:hypothetical protein
MDETPWHLLPDVDVEHVIWYGQFLNNQVQCHKFLGDYEALLGWTMMLEEFSRKVSSYESYRAQLAIEQEEKSRGIYD